MNFDAHCKIKTIYVHALTQPIDILTTSTRPSSEIMLPLSTRSVTLAVLLVLVGGSTSVTAQRQTCPHTMTGNRQLSTRAMDVYGSDALLVRGKPFVSFLFGCEEPC